nr:uncharacterized mitochondrial protein AtMg00810-like [Tanacetum cinerariifolium]
MKEHIWYEIGDGKSILVWYDKWHSIEPLSQVHSKRDVYDPRMVYDFTMVKAMERVVWKWPIKQKQDGIFISHDKYVAEILKKFGLTEKPLHKDPDVKRIFRYLKGKPNLGLWYPKDSPFDLVAYSDSDYAGASLDTKSTTGGCQFLGSRLISWQCKKQTVVATSSMKAEYVAGASCYAQVLWIQNQMLDYGKSDTSEGFDQIIDFINGSYIAYALTVNPTIYVSCIKQLWRTVAIKSLNDVTRLQALVDKKRVMVTEAAIRDALHLDDDEGDLSTHSTKYISPALTQKIFANIRRVGKGYSGVETPLFEGMIVARKPENQGNAEEHGDEEEQGIDNAAAEEPVTVVDDVQSPPPQQQSPPPAQPHGAHFPMSLLQEALDAYVALTRCVEHLEHDKVAQDLDILRLKTRVKKLERANKVKTVKLRRLRKVGTSQRIEEYTTDTQVEGREADIYHIDMDYAAKVLISVAAAVIPSAVPETISTAAIPTITTLSIKVAGPVKAVVPSTRQKRGVVIRDLEEESFAKTPTETTSKDKGKGILVEEPKSIKKKQQVEYDKAYARKIQEEFNKDIDWEAAIDHVKQRAKEEPFIQRYQVIKKRPQTEAQAWQNMMMYLKNTAGFTLDYFKGMSYDDIRLILIVPDEDDDVFTEATPLARKVPIMDYQVILVNYKPRYKIIKADDTHQLYASFITMLKFFDKEDLETLWRIVKERFSTSKPNNFSDEYLLTALKTMFERPDVQDNKIPTHEVHTGTNAKCSKTSSGRRE